MCNAFFIQGFGYKSFNKKKKDNAVFETMIRYIDHVKTFHILGAENEQMIFLNSRDLDI